MEEISTIDKGFEKRINIEEAKGSAIAYKAALRLHGTRKGYIVDVDATTGDAVWSAATTKKMAVGSYDLEVWDASLTSQKYYRQERFALARETYLSVQG